MEVLGLSLCQDAVCANASATDLAHVGEHLLSAPPWQVPVVEILLSPANTKRAVDTRAAPQELTTTEFNLTVVNARHWWCDQVPVSLGVEVLAPATSHLDVLIVLAIRSCFDEQDAIVDILRKPGSDHTATRASSTIQV